MILLLHTRAAWAEETTARGISSTVYAGAGKLSEPNNETSSDAYAVKRAGVAVLGVWRRRLPRTAPPDQDRGFFAAFGAGIELEDSALQPCSGTYSCFADRIGKHSLGTHVAARLGAGYSWRLFEFRVGVLGALPDARVTYAEPVVLPDVLLRVGDRSLGWFELGLGAYDASTNLRPGVYVGGAIGSDRVLRVSGHVGAHFVNGFCCSTVLGPGIRYELGATHALTDSLRIGAGAALLEAGDDGSRFVVEGRASLAWAF
ncbi:MAG: hypothetical protein EOO73_21210 [Myxococcales bacterium]|nr:MAG: hypothetical protein EOO73_21210 [Myxococcales bacterium]